MRYKLLIVFSFFIFVNCSNDDGDNKQPPDPYILEAIIGSWSYESVEINGVLYAYGHVEGCDKDSFKFYNEEGKEFEFDEVVTMTCDICENCPSSTTTLDWDLQGNIVHIYSGEQLITKLEILEVETSVIKYKRFFDFDEDGTSDELVITGFPYDPYGLFD